MKRTVVTAIIHLGGEPIKVSNAALGVMMTLGDSDGALYLRDMGSALRLEEALREARRLLRDIKVAS